LTLYASGYGPYEFIAAIGILGLAWVRASRISEK